MAEAWDVRDPHDTLIYTLTGGHLPFLFSAQPPQNAVEAIGCVPAQSGQNVGVHVQCEAYLAMAEHGGDHSGGHPGGEPECRDRMTSIVESLLRVRRPAALRRGVARDRAS
jgi:hypothetical protein